MMVGLNGLEPSTSRLSGVRSNQLSYRPIGAGDGNRTHDISLEGWSFTIKLHPHYLNLKAAPGFEPGIKVLQTSALPLGYAAMTGLAGFEPTHDGVKVRCLTAWL
jgi:hypothetical protein